MVILVVSFFSVNSFAEIRIDTSDYDYNPVISEFPEQVDGNVVSELLKQRKEATKRNEPLVETDRELSCSDRGRLLYTVKYTPYGDFFYRLKIYPDGSENVIKVYSLPLFKNACL